MNLRHLLAAALIAIPTAHADPVTAYFSTYTGDGGSQGIYRATFDTETGELSDPELAAETTNPSFLEIGKDGRFLYAAGEGGANAGVTAFAIGGDKNLTKLNTQPSGGSGPCHVSVDPTGRAVLVANYGSGSAALLPINDDGSLAPPSSTFQHEGSGGDERRQKGPHAHSINASPDGRFALVADLGIDKVMVYRMDAQAGTLTPNDPSSVSVAPGAGPRHFAFHPSGAFAYVINELTKTVTAFRFDAATGTLTETQTVSTVPPGTEPGGSTAEIRVHPSGKFVYGSNRGHDSIAIFAVNADDGTLTPAGHQPSGGQTPRNFNIAPGGNFLLAANQESGNVAVFAIDQASGALEPTGRSIDISKVVCVRFLSDSQPVALFDGSSLDGWEGDETFFRVEDGTIVAGSLDKPIPQNEFLVSEEEFGDFDLELEAKLVGEGKNAGVQFWSQRVPDDREMIGYQCDIGEGGDGRIIWGALYDESRRRVMLATVDPASNAAKSLQPDDWNHLRIRAVGAHIQIWLNGYQTLDYHEEAPEIPTSGHFGLQIHSGSPTECRYRNLRLQHVP
ncbi:hypothetical protein BH23VER1_BH23VER1_00410 [soil metagenome]